MEDFLLFSKKKFASLQPPSLILVVLLSGCCWAPKQELEQDEPHAAIENTNEDCTLREIEYFLDIALGVEYGTSESVKRWSGTITYQTKGSPTTKDKRVVRSVMRELRELTGNRIRFKPVTNDPEVVIWFVPVSDMSKYEPEYIEGNWGFMYLWWNDTYEIYKASILIGSNAPNQKERNHLIREEMTQSLGLINDSWKYRESIFYQGWSEIQEFADIDKRLVRMLYSDAITPGMSRKEAMDALMKFSQ
jgi:hypothetical protein